MAEKFDTKLLQKLLEEYKKSIVSLRDQIEFNLVLQKAQFKLDLPDKKLK